MSIQQMSGPENSIGQLAFVERSAATSTGSTSVSAERASPGESRPAESRSATVTEVSDAVERLNRMVQQTGQGILFSIDNDTGRNVVKVVDTETQKVLRQFPSEAALAIAKTLDSAKGLLISHKV